MDIRFIDLALAFGFGWLACLLSFLLTGHLYSRIARERSPILGILPQSMQPESQALPAHINTDETEWQAEMEAARNGGRVESIGKLR